MTARPIRKLVWSPARRLPTALFANARFLRVVVILVLFLLWEIAGHTILDTDFLSPPTAIALAMPRVIGDPAVAAAIAESFYELAVAFIIAVVAGVVVGLLVGLHPLSLQSGLPIILLAYAVPQVTVLPLFVLYFGIGPPSKIAFGVSHGIFPIILNVISGMRSIDPAHLTVARSMGADRWQVIRRVVLPSMIPSLFAGLRIAMSATLLGVLLAELYVSTGGIGYFARLFSDSFDPPATFALVTVLTLMAILLNEISRRAEVRASAWRNADQ